MNKQLDTITLMAQLEQLAWTFSKPSLHCFGLHPAHVLKSNSFQKAAEKGLEEVSPYSYSHLLFKNVSCLSP